MLTQIASDLVFAEGPLWHREGFLIFSDIGQNKILKVQNGRVETFLDNSGWRSGLLENRAERKGSNAIAYDLEGNIIFCQHGDHAIVRLLPDGSLETIADTYNHKRLNSPNDLCVGKDGSIYFSDPPYGLKNEILNPVDAQPHAGVYRWYNGVLELLTTEYNYPNGVCFSPDYKYLFIGSNDPSEKRIRRYEVINGVLYNGITYVEENADGIKMDSENNLYLATMEGILILSECREKLALIKTPEMATNLCFHDEYIYITTVSKVYEYKRPGL